MNPTDGTKENDEEQIQRDQQKTRGQIASKETEDYKSEHTEEQLIQSEKNLIDLIEILPVGIAISTVSGEIVDANQAILKMHGYATKEELVNSRVQTLWYDPKDRDKLVELTKKGPVNNYETRLKKKDGTLFWGSLSATCKTIEDGIHLIISVIDISDRKQAGDELRESEEKYKSIVENCRDLIMLSRPDGKITYLSPICKEILGYDPDKLVGTQPCIFHPDDLEKVKKIHYAALEGNSGSGFEYRIITKDQKIKWVMHSWSPIFSDGELKMIVSVVKDITDRKVAEEALRESEERYRSFLKDFKGIAYKADMKTWTPFFFHGDVEEITGYREKEFISGNPSWDQVIHPADLPGILAGSSEKLRTIRDFSTDREYRIIRKDGEIRWIYELVQNICDESGEPAFVQGTLYNITDRKQIESELKKERDRAQKYLDVAGVMFVALDAEQKITMINKRGCEILGCEEREVIGMNWFETFCPERRKESQEKIFNRLMSGEVEPAGTFEDLVLTKSGEEKLIAWHNTVLNDDEGRIIGTLSSGTDITEKRKLEEEILRTSKLESVGMLAGGIAHDFNNILTAIIGNISLAQEKIHPEDDVAATLRRAETASMQARDLTQQLLTFAKGGIPVKETTSISKLLEESVKFALRGSNVRCNLAIASNLWPVEVDKGQIRQVVNNIVINAKQAMLEGGAVEVIGENVSLGKAHGLPIKSDKCVRISFTDQGAGISKDHLRKIFDPYFTTKKNGSGLGLATVYSIVRNHEGYIAVESELGTGTTFHVYLPASEKEIPVEVKKKKRLAPCKGSVLVMDDERIIREVLGEMLDAIGYETEFAEDGMKAIDVYKNAMDAGQPFGAVILDLTVPGGMGGKEAVRRLLQIDPNVKAIVSSGYSNDPIMADYIQYGFSGVVAKPYKISELREMLGRMTTSDH